MQELYKKATVVGLFCFLTAIVSSAQETLSLNESLWTNSRKTIFANRTKTEVTLSLPHKSFLRGEYFPITVSVHNPTPSALELPVPFDIGTGWFSVEEKDSRQAKEFGLEYFPMPPSQPTELPLSEVFILAARESKSRTFWSRSGGHEFPVNIVLHPGKYRLRYTYGPSNYAYFEVLDAIPADRLEVLDLAGTDPKVGGIRRTAIFSAKLGDAWWLFQTWPSSTDRLLPAVLRSRRSPITSNDLFGFSRVARLPGPLSRLSASLIGDVALHIEYETLDGGSRTIETKLATGEAIREW